MKALDIRAIREQSKKSQMDFAYMIGVSVATQLGTGSTNARRTCTRLAENCFKKS